MSDKTPTPDGTLPQKATSSAARRGRGRGVALWAPEVGEPGAAVELCKGALDDEALRAAGLLDGGRVEDGDALHLLRRQGREPADDDLGSAGAG